MRGPHARVLAPGPRRERRLPWHLADGPSRGRRPPRRPGRRRRRTTLLVATLPLLDTVCSMSSDESQKAADDSLKTYERKLPAESAVTTEHTVEIKGNLVPYLLRPTLLSACSRSSYRQ